MSLVSFNLLLNVCALDLATLVRVLFHDAPKESRRPGVGLRLSVAHGYDRPSQHFVVDKLCKARNVFCLSLKLFGHLDPMHEYPRWCPRRYPLRACRFVISHASIASVFGMNYRFKGLRCAVGLTNTSSAPVTIPSLCRNNEMISIPASSAVG